MKRFTVTASILALLGIAAIPYAQSTFKTRVNVVPLDVLVIDKNHRPIADLTAADFTVIDNGKSTPIVAFSAISIDSSSTNAAAFDSPSAAVDPPSRLAAASRLIAIVFDDAGIRFDPGDAKLAREIAWATIDELTPGDLSGVFFTFLGTEQDFTTDRASLRSAVETLVPHPGTLNCGIEPGGCVVKTLSRVADILRAAPFRRKLVVLVSSRGGIPLPNGRMSMAGADLILDLFRKLQDANIAVYAFNPAGLQTGAANAASRAPVRTLAPRGNESLKAFAENTGGRAIVDDNEPWRKVADVLLENSYYYLVGIRPSDSTTRGSLHRVEVRVNRKDAEVRSRREYVVPN